MQLALALLVLALLVLALCSLIDTAVKAPLVAPWVRALGSSSALCIADLSHVSVATSISVPFTVRVYAML